MSGRGLPMVLRAAGAVAALAPTCLFYLVASPFRRARLTPLERAIQAGEDRKDQLVEKALRRRARLNRMMPALAARDPARPRATQQPFATRSAASIGGRALGA